MDKREFLTSGLAVGAMIATSSNFVFANENSNDLTFKDDKFVLPPLPYAYNALEEAIDEQTMKLHHDIHHKSYVDGLNKATEKIQEAIKSNDYALIKHWQREIAFHGSGHFLHSIFWNNMSPNKSEPNKTLSQYINKSFNSFDEFKKYFIAASSAVEGSGWGILAYNRQSDRLTILQAEKHQNLGQWVSTPILALDVWEHAYYIRYQNKRAAYCENFFKVINWNDVSERLERLVKA